MNADAYLRKQGWKGSGHSLDMTGRGIKKPLLIAHKQDQMGLGKKKAAHTTDDQWWMRAFDQSLQSIGTGKESTLSQIRTQGINRGGLYGFFVKGEAIAGTIEDASATTTDTSTPASGASTPPTSASDTDAPTHSSNMAVKDKKRKRAGKDVSDDVKKAKTVTKKSKSKRLPNGKVEGKDQAAVAAKLAKLKPSEKAEYTTRAAAKDQTLEQYVLRRIQKKVEKRATKYVEPSDPLLFFTDLEGDANLATAA
ncbi:Nn.00g072460.m01.CDS01 [Neocucurbitaria sp. VM-36]